MRIWHQSMTDLTKLETYKEGLVVGLQKTKLTDQFHCRVEGVEGLYGESEPTDALAHSRIKEALLGYLRHQCQRAEEEKYDAFIIGSFSEPHLWELRKTEKIEIYSILECALLWSMRKGYRIGIITNSNNTREIINAAVAIHGASQRVLSVEILGEEWKETLLENELNTPKQIKAVWEERIASMRSKGVDVVIPGEGILNLIVSKFFSNNRKLPILADPLHITWRWCQSGL